MKRTMRIKFTFRWSLLCTLVIIGGYLPPTVNIRPIAATIQPDLLHIIQSTPNVAVNVIIQQKMSDRALEQVISQLGGKVTKKLPIINALVAQLPARQIRQLAQDPRIHWISLDAPVVATGCDNCIATNNLSNVYNSAIRADQIWNEAPYRQGQNVTVAVVDSGINKIHGDFGNRVTQSVNIAYPDYKFDGYGHGTYVAGIVGGDGLRSQGAHIGVAPKVNLLDVRVTSFAGAATESDVVAGLQWIYDHRVAHNIRVVNLSFNTASPQSYHTSPLNAACEVLWFNGIVVVAAAGNHGSGALYPPANDPFVITVGAVDDRGTMTISDDQIASFSAYGVTTDGIAKPDIVAPGRNLVGPVNSKFGILSLLRPQNLLSDKPYFRMSGTSAAAPVVSGAIALLLQAEPHLTPDQVKYRLLATANKSWQGYEPAKAGAGYVDIYAAIHTKSTESANTSVPISQLLMTNTPVDANRKTVWDSISWSSISWSSISWSSISWSSNSWSSISWSSDYWETDNTIIRASDLLATEAIAMMADESILSTEQPPHEKTTMIFLPIILTITDR